MTNLKDINNKTAIILGIESSCDETALAIIRGDKNSPPEIISESLFSQIEEHQLYGGVVPEIAARSHGNRISYLLSDVMHQAQINFNQIDAVAATSEPGLIGGVLVGLMVAKGICVAYDKPLIAVNHLEGHALSPRLSQNIDFPYLLLLVSGGHCQILIVYDIGNYELLGTTIDDSAGEAFDKVAKMLDLGFPGGPSVEKMAKQGDSKAYLLPRPLKGTEIPNFSFSGLKTAMLRNIEKEPALNRHDLCASFQNAVIECFLDRLKIAMNLYKQKLSYLKDYRFVVAGGVAANQSVRKALQDLCCAEGFTYAAPPLKYCTDNGVMIAYAGLQHYFLKNFSPLDYAAKARSPLGLKTL